MSSRPKPEYAWKEGARLSVDPQAVGDELEHLRRRYKRVLPEAVVAAARSMRSPLHAAFEWDDDTAAERYRLDQARYILRQITVRVVREDNVVRSVRAFWFVDGDEKGYTSLRVVMRSEPLRKQVLARAWKELEEWRARYQDLEELAHVFDAMEMSPAKAGGRVVRTAQA